MYDKPVTFYLTWDLPLPSGASLFVKYEGATPPEDADKIDRYMRIIRDTIMCVHQEAANSQTQIEEAQRADTERAANAEGTLTHKPLPPSPEENGDV